MLKVKKIVYLSFLGATLILLLPPIFFMGLSVFEESLGLVFHFLVGWAVLGVSLFFHSKFVFKYTSWLPIISYSLLLLFFITALDILISAALLDKDFNAGRPPIPMIPESIIQNTILSTISLVYVFQHFQRKRSEANNLRIVQLQNENLKLQLSSLQQQINPHFFFNSLNTLSELIYIDIEKSEEYINRLSKVFRYILDVQQKALIPLDEELTFIQSYFYLLKIRFEDKINLQLPGELNQRKTYKIPSLSLLVLFENVTKHNAISESKPIDLELQLNDTYLSVKNNKNPLTHLKHPSLGIGLANLKNRCLLLTKKPCIIENNDQFFNVKIPLVAYNEHHHN